uniref:dUTPase-like domain-containing protein n=1 Tax=Amazona collaria TaxID=241587 RepID=A0A8B9IWB3_9PSIT
MIFKDKWTEHCEVAMIANLNKRAHDYPLRYVGGCLSELSAATIGSAGIDLAVGEPVTIKDLNMHIVPSTCTGLLGFGLSALLLGRSSTSKQGIFVLAGVIDTDYASPIGIMIHALNPPVTIPQGSKIAQLIPFKGCVPKTDNWIRGQEGIAFLQFLCTLMIVKNSRLPFHQSVEPCLQNTITG